MSDQPSAVTRPFVSVVTPFYNTALHLAECIESVLAQTHTNFEYLLVDNKSTDGSREIAESYARADPRIRVFENPVFVDQLRNFNGALERISSRSSYVKMVLADDVLYPECIERMVDLGEREPSAGLVSSYYLYGEWLLGAGLPRSVERLDGREACRRLLLTRFQITGTPSIVLYRAEAVRSRRPFFVPGRYHADTDTAFDILLEHDLGYVHQVLSFARLDVDSITERSRRFNAPLLHYVLLLERRGSSVLSSDEVARERSRIRAEYLGYLGRAALRRPGREFWDYHRVGLETVGWRLRTRDIVLAAAAQTAALAFDPRCTIQRLREIRAERAARDPSPRPTQAAVPIS